MLIPIYHSHYYYCHQATNITILIIITIVTVFLFNIICLIWWTNLTDSHYYKSNQVASSVPEDECKKLLALMLLSLIR